MSYPGLFVVFEGIDGAGKSTQIERLLGWYRAQMAQGFPGLDYARRPWTFTRQPGGSWVGSVIHNQIMLTPEGKHIDPDALEHLFLADRLQHAKDQLVPALEQGHVVVCDRYWYSGMAYALARRNVSDRTLGYIREVGQPLPVPDVVVWMDGEPSILLERAKARSDGRQVLKSWGLNLEFQERVRRHYYGVLLQARSRSRNQMSLYRFNEPGDAEEVFRGHVLPPILRVMKQRFRG